MATPHDPPSLSENGTCFLRFESFEVNLHDREVRKHGLRLKVHGASFEVLRALLERPGHVVTRDELRERLWPDGTFVDYDNSLNSTVNRLREALNDSAEKPRYIETLPRLGYRFIALVEAAAEVVDTPPRLAAAPSIPDERFVPHPPAGADRVLHQRWAALLAFACLGGLALYFALGPGAAPASQPTATPTLAVIPLQPAPGGNHGLGLLIAEDLIRQLARDPAIKVLPLSAGYRYVEHPEQIPQAGKVLGALVLAGTAIEDAGQVHLQLHLSGTETTPNPTWSRSLSLPKADLFRATGTLAEELRRHLHGRDHAAAVPLPAIERPATLEAYEDLLEGTYQLEQRTSSGISRAMDVFELAIRKDPNFAAPYAGLATAQSFDLNKWRDAERNARRALQLHPQSSEARTALGFIRLFWQRDWPGARDEFKTAIDLDPRNATAHHWYALYFAAQALFNQALTEIEEARRLNPYSPAILADLGHILILALRHDQAAEACRQALALAPEFLNAHACLYKVYRQTGKIGQATAKRAEIRNRLGRQLLEYPESYELAEDLALDGQIEDSMRMLERAYARSEPSIVFARANPVFRKLRDHPRYRALLKKLSLDFDFVTFVEKQNGPVH